MVIQYSVAVHSLCKLGKSASEMQSALVQVYGDNAQKKSAVYDSSFRIKNGQETLEDDQSSKLKKWLKICDK
jgi:hypothetical protein